MLVLAMQFSRGRYYADSGDVSTSPASRPSVKRGSRGSLVEEHADAEPKKGPVWATPSKRSSDAPEDWVPVVPMCTGEQAHPTSGSGLVR